MRINHRLPLTLAANSLLACAAAFANDPQSKAPAQQPTASGQHEAHTGHAATATSDQGSKSSEGSMAIHEAMMKGMKMNMPMSGDPDRDFATMMIQHHRQAIAMSEAQLKHGDDAEVRRTAQRIIDASRKDISELEKWRKQSVASAEGSKPQASGSRY